MSQQTGEHVYRNLMSETVESLHGRVPFTLQPQQTFRNGKEKVATSIGFIGDIACHFSLVADEALFARLAQSLHGIELPPDIVPSFVGEFWNLVLAPVIKMVKTPGADIDITPSRPAEKEKDEQANSVLAHYFEATDENGQVIGEIGVFCQYEKEEVPMKKVLIVDDTAFMRVLLRGIIERNGYEVIAEAANGQEAVEKYRELKPDLVTMDITMPEKDGIQALKEIREEDPEAKVIMCTAIDEQERMIQAIELGALEYFIKPFDEERISSMLKMIFEIF